MTLMGEWLTIKPLPLSGLILDSVCVHIKYCISFPCMHACTIDYALHVHVALSPGSFLAFQCCTLKVRNRPGDEASYVHACTKKICMYYVSLIPRPLPTQES